MNTPIRMNRRIITIVAILLIVGISVAKEYPPLLVNWRYPAKTQKIYSLDWDDDGVEEIFAFTSVSRGSKESYLRLNVLEPDGSLELDTDIRGWGTYSATTYTAADERLYGVYVDDINDDGDLDFFVGSWITWGSLNVHKFYRVDRITKEVGGDITHPLKLQWFHEGAGRMNDVEYLDGGILAACLEDAAIYKFTTDGTVEWKSDLEGAVWDIMPVDINRDGLTDILAGTFRSISVVDSSGGLTWDYTTDGRIWGVYAADLDGNIGNEVVGVSEDEEIYVLDSVGNLKSRFSLAGVTAGIVIADFDENGKAEIITASKDRHIYAINSDLWQDWNYSMDNLMEEWEYGASEAIQSLHVMEGESEKTLLVGTNKALYSFRINPDYVDDEKAKGYYDLALEYYTSRGLDELIEYATLAREIFVRLKDTGGVIKCDKLLLWGENGTLGDRKGLAEEHFSKAQELYGEDVLSNATYYAESAREIYDELGLIRGVMDCDLLLANIDNRWNEIMQDDIKAAEQNIIEAKVSYDGGNYEDAVSYAEKAKEVYLKVSDQDKIDECDSIIHKSGKRINAKSMYDKAMEYFEAGEYENSSQYAEDAKEVYLEIEDGGMVKVCERLIDSSDKYIRAQESYQKAKESYDGGDYDKAQEYAKEARDLYVGLGDNNGIEKCDSLFTGIDEKRNWYMDYVNYAIAAVFIIAIILVFLRMRKQSDGGSKAAEMRKQPPGGSGVVRSEGGSNAVQSLGDSELVQSEGDSEIVGNKHEENPGDSENRYDGEL
ncbi:MAG: VCBS repeat-containing protein [Candidatus Altiarchaeota archaeon]|nr:VCBS repeat-containing protein [Candidatus Altiarchaeota archaeon]